MIKKTLSIMYLVLAFCFAPALLADLTQVNYGVSDSVSYQPMPVIEACEACHSAPEQETQLRKQSNSDPTDTITSAEYFKGYGGSEGLTITMKKMPASYIEVGWR